MPNKLLASEFGRRSERTTTRRRTSLRVFAPSVGAILVLLAGHFLFGGASPIAALFLSACLILLAVVALLLAGPRHGTLGMALGAAAVWVYAVSGAAGPLGRALPELAVVFGAGAMWTIGFLCARQRGALDLAWAGLVWSSLSYCVWTFFRHIAGAFAGPSEADGTIVDFSTRPDAAIVFGLFALIGAARILHVVKLMDAEALSRSAMVDRLLRDALGGLLLLGFALTCLALTGSRVGMLLAASVLLLQSWWDTLGITQRDHRSRWVRWLALATPLIVAALAGWGIALSFLNDETMTAQAAPSKILPRLQRLSAYFEAWLHKPILGYGLGAIHAVRDAGMRLSNAEALSAPGGAQNVVLHWLVEGGVLGLSAFAVALAAVHRNIVRALAVRKTPRTFMRLAVCASALLALHGGADSSLDLPTISWIYGLLLGFACGVGVQADKTAKEASR